MKAIPFVKASGAGNDFIIIDNRQNILPLEVNEFVKNICRPKISIGADGVLLLENSSRADFKMRYFNADGSEAEMCGNGGRCIASYAFLMGIAKRKMAFETLAGIHQAEVAGNSVKLKMLDPAHVQLSFMLSLDDQEYGVNFVNTGVSHVVMLVSDVKNVDVRELGSKIRYHRKFSPEGTNVNFVQIGDQKNLYLRTYERGVEDETLACGTGAVAAASIMALLGKVKPPVNVHTQGGGILKVYFDFSGSQITNVFLEGEAKIIYEGKLWEEGWKT